MKKIKSLFCRNYETDGLVNENVVPGSEWVINGGGIATRKYDGTCCMVSRGELYARYDAKKGKTPPEGFIPAQEPDEVTGHWPGWIKCDRNNPQWQYHFEAFDNTFFYDAIGTYELCGPKINGNPENTSITYLLIIGAPLCTRVPQEHLKVLRNGLKAWISKASCGTGGTGTWLKSKRKTSVWHERNNTRQLTNISPVEYYSGNFTRRREYEEICNVCIRFAVRLGFNVRNAGSGERGASGNKRSC